MFILLFIVQIYAKTLSLKFQTKDLANSVTYLTKFGVNLGEGRFQIRARIQPPQPEDRPMYFRINTMTDDHWPSVQQETTCRNKQALTTHIHQEKINFDGSWSNFDMRIPTYYRDKIFILTYSDCDQVLQFTTGYIEFEITLLNNKSHFSCDQNGLHYLYGLQAIVSVLIGMYAFEKLRKVSELDGFMQGICLVLSIDFIAEIFMYLHYQVYYFNGKGFFLFDVLGSVLGHAATLLLAILFIALSQGWTINKPKFEIDKYAPMGLVIIVYQSVILLIIKYYDDREDKYHNFYGFGGMLLIIQKIGLTAIFAIGIKQLFHKTKYAFHGFLIQIGIIGVLFLLCYPIVVLISEVFVAAYWRLRVITMTHILVSHLSIGYIVYMCTSKKSQYFQIKNESQTII